MDQDCFDALTRTLATAGSRRVIVRTLVGSAAGGLLAKLGVGEAAAQTPKCQRVGQKCSKTSQCCASIANATATCANNRCTATCDAGFKPCGQACIPNDQCCTSSSDGSCPGGCPPGYFCENGGCFKCCGGGCGTGCANCSCDNSTSSGESVCVDYDFGIGACLTNADCPPGSFCDPYIGSLDPSKPHLCTRPCPCP